MTGNYPIVDRHTDQSWHERFKKNATPFTRRIHRLVADGVDRTLKTQRERAKTVIVGRVERESVVPLESAVQYVGLA